MVSGDHQSWPALLMTTAVYLKRALTLRLFAGSLPREDTTRPDGHSSSSSPSSSAASSSRFESRSQVLVVTGPLSTPRSPSQDKTLQDAWCSRPFVRIVFDEDGWVEGFVGRSRIPLSTVTVRDMKWARRTKDTDRPQRTINDTGQAAEKREQGECISGSGMSRIAHTRQPTTTLPRLQSPNTFHASERSDWFEWYSASDDGFTPFPPPSLPSLSLGTTQADFPHLWL